MIEGLRVTARKKDGAPLAFFKLTDRTGEVQIKCWSGPYARYKSLIEENAVVIIKGKMHNETEIDDEGQEIVTDAGISVNIIEKLTIQKTGKIIASVPSIFDWTDTIYQKAQKYADNNGCMLVVHDLLLDEVREANFRVSEKILSAGLDKDGITLVKLA
jgi:DNA polymerase III alpha subunit